MAADALEPRPHGAIDGAVAEVGVRMAIGSYARPRDLRYFFDFLSPILYAFLCTVLAGRPNLAATWAEGLFGKSFLSRLMSLFDHRPLMVFLFAIV